MSDSIDNKPSRRPAKEQDVETGAEASMPNLDAPGGREARSAVRRAEEAALAGMRSLSEPTSLGPLSVTTASPAEITDELEKGGPAFGAFVKAVGLAVAEAQQKLDETLVTTAKALSSTQIDVIAVFEQVIKDADGTMDTGNVITQKLPLINYLMPTAYQWSRVYLSADMQVKEFNGSNGFNIKGKSSSFSANARASYGLGTGFGASGGVSYSNSSYEASAETSFSRDEAAGSLHMEATLEPRADVQLPRPFIVQKGPRLKVTAGARTDITSGTPPVVTGRQISLSLELRDTKNNALVGKTLDFRISQPLLNYRTAPATTGNDGKLALVISREGAAYDATKPPEAVVVTVWYGLVSEQVVINI